VAQGAPKTLGQFEITGELGRGGMAVVFKGYQPSLDRHVAIKTLPADRTDNREMVSRFKREVSTMVALNHTNVVQIIDSGEEQGLHYYAMEFVDGPDLKGLMKEGLTIDQAFDISLQICDGLGYAHKKGMIHRDVKPANVLWETSTGLAKMADFGIAKDVSMVTLTGTDVGMGTMNYMAPEQKQQARDVDHRADIYAVGVVIYEMFTGGKLPMGRFKMPSELTPGLPKALDDVVAKCLETLPEDRYDSLAEVREGLVAARAAVSASGSERLLSIRDAAEKTLTAVAGKGQGGVVLGLCLVVGLLFTALAGGAYYVLVVRQGGEVASNGEEEPSPTESESPRPSESPKPTASESPKPTASESPKPTASESPKPTASETPKPTASETPKPSPTQQPRPSPSAARLSPEQVDLIEQAEALVARLGRLEGQWGTLEEVKRAGDRRVIPQLIARLRDSGTRSDQGMLQDLLVKVRSQATSDLLDGRLEPRLKEAEEVLGIDEAKRGRLASEMLRVAEDYAEGKRLTRYSLLLEDLIRLELDAYEAQAQSAYALAYQRGQPGELSGPAGRIKAAKAAETDLARLEELKVAVSELHGVGVPEAPSSMERVGDLSFSAKTNQLEGISSICPGDGGGVAAIARDESGGAYLLLLRVSGGAIQIDARQQVGDKAYWVASAGRIGARSSFWVGENSSGIDEIRRYAFEINDGAIRPLDVQEQLRLELDEDEYLLDIASGVDGTLHLLSNKRVQVYFGPEDQRVKVGEVHVGDEFVALPVPRRVSPLLNGRVVVTGDERSRKDVMRGGLWNPSTQARYTYVPKRFDWRSGRGGQAVRSPGPGPCGVVGLGDSMLGVTYGVGGALVYFSRVTRSGTTVSGPEKSNFLVTDVALVRGVLFVTDQASKTMQLRKRLTAYTIR
jgi:serine/threonine protein kinase